MSFLDYLLAGDTTGELQAMVDADRADLARGWMWGVFDGDRLVETFPARYAAEAAAWDNADATDRPGAYTVAPVRYQADGTGVTHCRCWYERQPDGTYDRVSTEDDCPDHGTVDWE